MSGFSRPSILPIGFVISNFVEVFQNDCHVQIVVANKPDDYYDVWYLQ